MSERPGPMPRAMWLTAEWVRTSIEPLLLDMLAPNLPGAFPRDAEMEELRRGVKLADVALEYLGLRTVGVDTAGEIPLRIVTPKGPVDPWRDWLVVPGSDQPIGITGGAHHQVDGLAALGGEPAHGGLGELGEVAARLRVALLTRAGGDVAARGVPFDEAVALERVERAADAVGRAAGGGLQLDHGPGGAFQHQRQY